MLLVLALARTLTLADESKPISFKPSYEYVANEVDTGDTAKSQQQGRSLGVIAGNDSDMTIAQKLLNLVVFRSIFKRPLLCSGLPEQLEAS